MSEENWRPIETAPKDGTEILAWWPHLRRARLAYWASNRFGEGWRGYIEKSSGAWLTVAIPSHWQPIPSPPSP